MPSPATLTLAPDDDGIARAAKILRDGGLVAFPTETVYGLGADACNDRAVARIFEAKGRPHFNPLIVHVADIAGARSLGHLGDAGERLASAFWPGPLTLVVRRRGGTGLAPLVGAGLDSVALRMPAHPLARRLLVAAGTPLAAPSANPSGRISPTCAAHVAGGLSGRIEAILDGGDCAVGVESTIVGLADGAPRLLRPGGLPAEAIEDCLGASLATAPAARAGAGAGAGAERPTSPGQLASHYAPRAMVRLAATRPEPDEIWIGYGPDCPGAAFNLSARGDLVEAAAQLFATLHAADALAAGGKPLAVAPVPEQGLGRAINDRLRRAAAPRE